MHGALRHLHAGGPCASNERLECLLAMMQTGQVKLLVLMLFARHVAALPVVRGKGQATCPAGIRAGLQLIVPAGVCGRCRVYKGHSARGIIQSCSAAKSLQPRRERQQGVLIPRHFHRPACKDAGHAQRDARRPSEPSAGAHCPLFVFRCLRRHRRDVRGLDGLCLGCMCCA